MARSSRFTLLALLIAGAAFLAYRYRPHPKTPPASVAEAHLAPILIPGVAEPDEMRVEPFPKATPNEPERMLGEAMKETSGNSDPNALLPALNRILAKYPDYGDGYQRTQRMITSRSKCRPRNNSSMLFSSPTVGPQFSKDQCTRPVAAICTGADLSSKYIQAIDDLPTGTALIGTNFSAILNFRFPGQPHSTSFRFLQKLISIRDPWSGSISEHWRKPSVRSNNPLLGW
jgi:hypothetical protein